MGHYVSEMGGRFTLEQELEIRKRIIARGKDPDKPYFSQLTKEELQELFKKET